MRCLEVARDGPVRRVFQCSSSDSGLVSGCRSRSVLDTGVQLPQAWRTGTGAPRSPVRPGVLGGADQVIADQITEFAVPVKAQIRAQYAPACEDFVCRCNFVTYRDRLDDPGSRLAGIHLAQCRNRAVLR